ncbi:glycerol-3-phosphate dehydrogenase/oxidase [Dechloromonas sp. HYN0024]|uniref:glycerol-3-phosphate dehydrogenase/oxidase n=1 Tax=Dechloromonas sp. HYN0024 TaxID=2231055 RepID=UPI000E4367BE|nr:glycerol-3-phosphate dehydrogenase/oxidase [Dechloromonas sp. HYN0024]AXS79884.1 glycerol-3-phosphate dehydrogenase/oxidase [Dechloromonas sp. HYN0024]
MAAREDGLAILRDGRPWDVLIIGGGASGLGAAVDSAARGYRTLLVEARDFASGTSMCSTKLIHGGVRYLRQGDIGMVRNALAERAFLLRNAPHLVHPLPFIIPAWNRIDQLMYTVGLKLYDLLAGSQNLDASCHLNRPEVIAALPGLRRPGLCGGVRYWDGQFDDARLAITLMRTATDLGATCLNYLPVTRLTKAGGRMTGALVRDAENGEEFEVTARAVINATGVHADRLRQLDEPAAAPLLTPSQGIHLVFDADFLPGQQALMIPKTEDGRVMFAIPWLGKVLLGSTDTPRPNLQQLNDPQPLAAEIDFLLRTAAGVLTRPPTRADIRSAFAGLRPLIHPDHNDEKNTAALSREHAILVSPSGLITVAGGKWTTYRLMAEQVIDRAGAVASLPAAHCPTRSLKLHGCPEIPASDIYGTDAPWLAALPGHDRKLHPDLPYTEAMVRFAIRHEAARTIDDILARRTRALFLDAAAAETAIDRIAQIVVEELAPPPERLAAMAVAARLSSRHFRRVAIE